MEEEFQIKLDDKLKKEEDFHEFMFISEIIKGMKSAFSKENIVKVEDSGNKKPINDGASTSSERKSLK